jgi:glycosyltransferase involved in cell wall biosynthesis
VEGDLMAVKVSVIVPFRNARSQLPALVDALQTQTCGPDAMEVIWVDDGSRDDGADWLQGRMPLGWQLLRHGRRRGAYAARNTALGAANAELVAFTDVDCRPYRDWIDQGLARLTTVARVAGRVQIELSTSPTVTELVDAGRFFRQRRYVQEGFGATANLFVRRSVFREVGVFNERLKSGGDYEFGLRCSRAGIPIEYADHVVVRHPARTSIRELLSKSERVGFGTGQLVRRGGIPLKLLVSRASDRFALARRRSANERMVSVDGRTRSLAVSGVHALVLLATIAGALRGFVVPGPAPEPTGASRGKVDSL